MKRFLSLLLLPLVAYCAVPVKQPAKGPCVLSEDPYKCTIKGYYETVQCDSSACSCINPLNGRIAFDTTTESNTKQPTCSKCFNYLKSLFARGEPPVGTFVPRCDVALGNYEPLQCDARHEFCYCVDPASGSELAGTRKRKTNNAVFRCEGQDFHVEDEYPEYPAVVQPRSERTPVGPSYCRLPRDQGTVCTNGTKGGVKYYFDPLSASCLAFNYNGCGGNQNRFVSMSECWECLPADFSSCALSSMPALDTMGQSMVCGSGIPMPPPPPPGAPVPKKRGPTLGEDGCPKGFECSMGAFFGTCCNKAMQATLNADYSTTKCPKNQKAYQVETGGITQTVYGSSCADNFCPKGYTCQKGNYFAYCCK